MELKSLVKDKEGNKKKKCLALKFKEGKHSDIVEDMTLLI